MNGEFKWRYLDYRHPKVREIQFNLGDLFESHNKQL